MQKFRTFSKGAVAAIVLATVASFFVTGDMNRAMGQSSGPVQVLYPTAAPSGACGYTQVRVVRSSGNIYGCVSGTWTLIQTSGSSSDWNTLTNKPSTFTPSTHASTHVAAGTDPLTLSASQVGLGNVNNTSDANKPVSTAQQTALNAKVDTTTTVNGHALSTNVTVTKGDVGLGSVDNTSDVAKPVSTATATALAGKVDTTRTVNGLPLSSNISLAKGDIGLGNVDNTSDAAKPLSTAATSALAGKVATTTTVNGHALSSNVTVTTTDLGLQNVNNTSDANKPISTATQSALDSLGLLAFRGKGTYNNMTACTTNCPANSLWLLTNAISSGLCTSGSATNTAYAICIKDSNAIWQPILAITGGGGTTTTTIYGGWTGGGTTRVVSDTTCNGTDDTAAVQAVINTAVSGDTIDFQNTTNSCDINVGSIGLTGGSNLRFTHSPTTHPTNGDIKGVSAARYNGAYSTIFILDTCTNCLVDKLKINAALTKGQGFFCHFCTNSSMQNNEIYNVHDDNGGPGGPYAGLKCDGGSGNFIVSNNIHDTTGVYGGEGVRGIWAGAGGEYETNITIKDNTVANTGHTGIASESQNPLVTGNTISNQTVQGTCMKYIARGTSGDAVWDSNFCNNVVDAGGMQVDADTVKAQHIYVRNNNFKLIASNCLVSSHCQGALYLSGAGGSPSGNYNIIFTGNTTDQCFRLSSINNAHFVTYQNNIITNPRSFGGSDGTTIDLEDQDTDITVVNSGNVNVYGTGSGFARVTVDGVVIVAWMPKPFQQMPGVPSRETMVYASLAGFILFDRYRRSK